MGNKHPKEEKPRQLRPPKHLLWGCNTPEEHYAYIEDACEKVKEAEGEEGLKLLGFEFRKWHNPDTCVCEMIDGDGGPRGEQFDEFGPSGGDEDWEEQRREEEENGFNGDGDGVGESYMVPIGMSLRDLRPENRNDTGRSMTSVIESTIDKLSHHGDRANSSRNLTDDPSLSSEPTKPVSRTASNVSLFSLATHHSSCGSLSEDEECSLRLYHTPSGSTLVSSENHETFVASGKMYDEVARLCMEYAQTVMVNEGDLRWVSICDARHIRAMVSRDRASQNEKSRSRKVLLIVTGKGKVRAGIFSRRHLITTGVEAATAVPLIREAVRRDMEIVILDPNATGDRMGMDTVEASLELLFFQQADDEEEIYVLAHSMAGAQLVRFLHNRSSSTSKSLDGDMSIDDKAEAKNKMESTASFLRKIKAVAFTDSNHNIQWTRTNKTLTNLLVGPSCIYIKSHKLHEDNPKYAGEPHHECQFWRRRFGDIKTMWAGTHEHALTNYTARFHIWDHFDSFFHPSDETRRNACGEGKESSREEMVLAF